MLKQEFAQAKTEEALKTLIEIASNRSEPASARVSAANAILDRGWGKPTLAIAGDPDNPVKLDRIERVIVVNTGLDRIHDTESADSHEVPAAH